MSIGDTYIRVREAATMLGVALNTVRKSGAEGKIPEYRHLANGYRLDKRQDWEAFLRKIEDSRTTARMVR
jgi:excisionase family DNA binding protein